MSGSESDEPMAHCGICGQEVVEDINDYSCSCGSEIMCQNCYSDHCVDVGGEGYCKGCLPIEDMVCSLEVDDMDDEYIKSKGEELRDFADFIEQYRSALTTAFDKTDNTITDAIHEVETKFKEKVKRYDYRPFEHNCEAGEWPERHILRLLGIINKVGSFVKFSHEGFNFQIAEFTVDSTKTTDSATYFIKGDVYKQKVNRGFYQLPCKVKHTSQPENGYLFTQEGISYQDVYGYLKKAVDELHKVKK